MDMRRLINRIAALSMSAIMMLSMSGCGDSSKVSYEAVYSDEAAKETALMIGDYEISLSEIIFYAIQDLTLYSGYSSKLQTEENQLSHKDKTLGLLRETKILYNTALYNKVELNDNDLEARDKLISSFKNSVPQKVLDKYGITDELIEQVFTERTYVEKFQNDIKNDMGQTMTEDVTEAMKDYNFITMYYMTFPIVEVENDSPKKDEDGNYVYLSDAEKKKVKENAEAAVKEIKAGNDAEEVAEKYGVAAYCTEQKGYVGSFGEEIDKMLENAEAGYCVEPFEDTLGYVIIYVKNAHDDEMRDAYIYSLVSESVEDQMEALQKKWLATIEVDEEKDVVGTAWADFDIVELALTLEDAGVLVKPE